MAAFDMSTRENRAVSCRYGFYDELEEMTVNYPEAEMNGYLEMVSTGHGGYRASDFLHGFCWEFAIALHKRYGYPIIALKNHDALIHAYCQIKDIDEYPLFIDVRGVTDTHLDILNEFQDELTDDTIEEAISESDLDLDECDEEALFAAESLIDNYPDYYEYEI